MATVVAIAAIVAASCGRINTVSIANDEVSLTCATIAGIPVLCGVYEEATVEVPIETVVETVIAEVVGEDTPIPPTQTPPENTLTETIVESIQTEYQGEPAALEDVVQDIIEQIPEASQNNDIAVADLVETIEQLITPQPTPTTPTQEAPIPQPIQTIVQTVVEEVVEQEQVVETPTEQIADEIIIETVYQDDDGEVETEDIVEDIIEKLPESSKKDDVSVPDVVEKVEEKVEEIKESTTPPDQSSPTPTPPTPPTNQQPDTQKPSDQDQQQPDWTQVPAPADQQPDTQKPSDVPDESNRYKYFTGSFDNPTFIGYSPPDDPTIPYWFELAPGPAPEPTVFETAESNHCPEIILPLPLDYTDPTTNYIHADYDSDPPIPIIGFVGDTRVNGKDIADKAHLGNPGDAVGTPIPWNGESTVLDSEGNPIQLANDDGTFDYESHGIPKSSYNTGDESLGDLTAGGSWELSYNSDTCEFFAAPKGTEDPSILIPRQDFLSVPGEKHSYQGPGAWIEAITDKNPTIPLATGSRLLSSTP